ncbi:MAG: hypothetical protein JSV80_12785 [Acidobacteriota bacterium]|nr:MAG: hypothetical protein JSV80_12785 [Acidobacteriota bacterium]
MLRSLLCRPSCVPLQLSIGLLGLVGLTSSDPCQAADEVVFVNRTDLVGGPQPDVAGDPGLLLVVTRPDGETLQLLVGPGCEEIVAGDVIDLHFAGHRPRPDSSTISLDASRRCPVLSVMTVRIVRAPASAQDEWSPANAETVGLSALQRGLAIVGYDVGLNGAQDRDGLIQAFARYRADRGHDADGKAVHFSLWALALEVLIEKPRDPEARQVAETLLAAAEDPRPSR